MLLLRLAGASRMKQQLATAALLERLAAETAVVPAIWHLELGNVLIGAERRKRISYPKIVEFIALLDSLTIETDPHATSRAFHEVLLLSHSEGLTAYGAAYLELAMRLGLPLATKDEQLREAAMRFRSRCIKYFIEIPDLFF